MENCKKEIKSALPEEVLVRLKKAAEISETPVQNIILDAVLAYLDSVDEIKSKAVEGDGKEYIEGWRDGRDEGFDKGFEAGEAHAYETIMRRVRSEMTAKGNIVE